MGKIVVVAEKPSVGRDIARAPIMTACMRAPGAGARQTGWSV